MRNLRSICTYQVRAQVGHLSAPQVTCHRVRGSCSRYAPSKVYAGSEETSETVAEFLERRKRKLNPYSKPTKKGAKQAVRTLLGVDYSPSKTGIAVSTDGFAPKPLMVRYTANKGHICAKQILDIAQKRGCDGIVVGVPTTPNQRLWDSQQDSRIGRRCRNFAYTVAMVAKPVGLHVFIVSERYSTTEASILLEESTKSKKKSMANIDAASAAIILERFFMDREGSVLMLPKFGLANDNNNTS